MFYCPLLYHPQTEPFLAVLYKCNLDLSLSHEIAGSFWNQEILEQRIEIDK